MEKRISIELLNATLAYLEKRPLGEVVKLWSALATLQDVEETKVEEPKKQETKGEKNGK